MLNVLVDGQPLSTNVGAVRSMPDLIELIKASIDPDTIIASVSLNGQVLSEADWRAPLSVQGNGSLEVVTTTREQFVADRLQSSMDVVQHVILEFVKAREHFEGNDARDGNKALGTAIVDLKAFLDWYNSVLTMLPASFENERETYMNHVRTIAGTCEQILQQQLFQSWWALSQTLEGKLEPQLNELRTLCEKVSQESATAH